MTHYSIRKRFFCLVCLVILDYESTPVRIAAGVEDEYNPEFFVLSFLGGLPVKRLQTTKDTKAHEGTTANIEESPCRSELHFTSELFLSATA
jgi:hypothetical protein